MNVYFFRTETRGERFSIVEYFVSVNRGDLNVFIFVAKSNNVTEAAHSLNVSASTVSRKLAGHCLSWHLRH
ncbi:helix-turn-helix domain-containing protein [Pseudomonas bubulae]|uniref:helix-turn-helix domain-containing protein n=1 Tax=Pseudomonas bubulae TaxID=2316085 RepID=UPI001F1F8FA5|nr:LysR family transcriptional regulator [Pseudomonas bubulae]MCF3194514.1 hypothetical protein [Pseudomonas bubulae]